MLVKSPIIYTAMYLNIEYSIIMKTRKALRTVLIIFTLPDLLLVTKGLSSNSNKCYVTNY